MTGIVLAGGRSRRFRGDKLAASFGGRPLLDHAILGLAPIVDELVVVIAPEDDPPALPQISVRAVVVRDALPGGGPLVALLAGLRAANAALAVVVGGDMPLVVPAVVRRLAGAAADPAGPGASALAEGGIRRPLPCAFRVERALPIAERLAARGERSLRSVLDALDASVIAEVDWRALDPAGTSLLDVDTPADLVALEERTSGRRP